EATRAPPGGDPPAPPAAGGAADGDQVRLGAAETLPDWAEDNLRRKDPAVDRWPSEVLHDRAKKVLSSFLTLVTGEAAWDEQKLGDWLAPGFRGTTELRPGDLRLVFDDGSARAWKPAAELGTRLCEPAALRAVLARLRAPFAGGKCHSFFKIVRVHL